MKFRIRPEKSETSSLGQTTSGGAAADSTAPGKAPGEESISGKTISSGNREGSGISQIQDRSQIRPMNRTYMSSPSISVTNAARKKKRANLIRGLLVALALPLTAGSMYMFLAQQGDINTSTSGPAPLPTAITPAPRQPANALGSGLNSEPSATPEVYLGSNVMPAAGSVTVAQVPPPPPPPPPQQTETVGVIELDWLGRNANGPFYLDNEGRVIFNKTRQEERWKSLAEAAQLPANIDSLKAVQISHPLSHRPSRESFISDENFRLAIRRMNSDLEMQQIVQKLDALTTNQIKTTAATPTVIANLSSSQSSTDQQLAFDNLASVMDWTVLTRLTGEQRFGNRVKVEVLAWARNYKPRGDALGEARLTDLAKSYAILRESFTAAEQKEVDEFFVNLVDKQFPLILPRHRIDAWVLAHFALAVHVAHATSNGAIARYVNNLGSEVSYRRTWGTRELDDRELVSATQILDAALIFDQTFNNSFKNDNDGRPLQFLVDRIRDELSNHFRVGKEIKPSLGKAWLAATPFAPDLGNALTRHAAMKDTSKLMAHVYLSTSRPDRVLMPVTPAPSPLTPTPNAVAPQLPVRAQNTVAPPPLQAQPQPQPQRQPSQANPRPPGR